MKHYLANGAREVLCGSIRWQQRVTWDAADVDCEDCLELLAQEVEMRVTNIQVLLVAAGSHQIFRFWYSWQGEFIQYIARYVSEAREVVGFARIALKVLDGADEGFVAMIREHYAGRCMEVI